MQRTPVSVDVPVSAKSLTFLSPADKPADDPEAVGDPYKTLFIARLVCSALLVPLIAY